MKKFLFLFCLCFLLKEFSEGQITFQKTYGGTGDDFGLSVQQTTDGGYIIGGNTSSFGAGSNDVYLIKTNATGDSLWTKTFGGIGYDIENAVQQTSDGGYIISGYTESFGAGGQDVYLIKTDADGNSLWSKTFGGLDYDVDRSVQQTIDGGYIIIAWTASFGAGNFDVYLIKTDANGDSLWTKTFGGIGLEVGFSVQQTTDGGYIIAGLTTSFGEGYADVYLIKTDANGDSLWTKTFGGTGDDQGLSVQQTTDGSYIITGYTQNFGAGGYDIYLIKTDSNGDSIWTKTFGGTSDDLGKSVQQTTDGGYITTGHSLSFGAGLKDIYLNKTDANGELLWSKTFGGTGDDIGYSVQQTTDEGYIITGVTKSFSSGDWDIYLIKTDSLGNCGCNEGNPATMVTSPATKVSSPATIVTSPPTVVTSPATIVGSGGIVTTLCSTVVINEITTDNLFFISPNPFTSEISITLQKQNVKQATISIKNILGQTVFEAPLPPDGIGTPQRGEEISTRFDLSFMEKGIYLLEINIDGERTVKKIVKE